MEQTNQTKQCTRCKEIRDANDFHRQTRSPSGRTAICKPCLKKYNAERYIKQKKDREGFIV